MKPPDLLKLPWLPLEARNAFPKSPAIYFVLGSRGKVLYVGQTINCCSRWSQHHLYDILIKLKNVKVAYYFVSNIKLLDKIERELINYFNPPFNKIKYVSIVKPRTKKAAKKPIKKISRTRKKKLV